MRIVLSGGGTGGHITPILTLAQALKVADSSLELVYIGEHNDLTDQLLAKSGLGTRYVTAGKFRRYRQSLWRTLFDFKSLLLNIRDIFKFIAGFFQSFWLLMRLKPKAVFVKGGYVGLPVGLAAWVLGIPLIIHESDAVMGLTNRILSHLATSIAVSWPVNNFPNLSHKRLVFTGNPIRLELLARSKTEANNYFKLEPNTPTLLILGGSSGAEAINQAIAKLLPKLLAHYQVIHSAGQRDYKRLSKLTKTKLSSRYHLYEFLDTNQLGLAYAASDVVISRAGMNTVAEIAALKLPTIIIPSPYLAGGHQLKNAELLETYQAAVILDQAKLDSRLLLSIEELIGSDDAKNLLKNGLTKLAHPDAANKLAKEILTLL